MNVIYCGQFTDSSGYGVAARGYLKALDEYTKKESKKINLKIHCIKFEGHDKTTKEEQALIKKYSFKNDYEIDQFVSKEYVLVWHLPAPSLVVHKNRHQNEWPTTEKLVRKASRVVNLAAWEYSEVPNEWTKVYNDYNFNSIIVPSKWNKETFSKCYGERDCHLLPHIVERPVKESEPPINFNPEYIEDKFTVFTMSQWSDRKGFDLLIKSFCSEFKNQQDVALVIKTYGNFVGTIYKEDEKRQNNSILEEIKRTKNSVHFGYGETSSVPIYFIPGILPFENISWFHENSSLFALTTRGEGFGLTVAEALMHKVPVLVPKEGGHTDYIKDEAAFFVDGHWQPEIKTHSSINCETSHYEPHIFSIRKKLREAYEMWKSDRKALKNKGVAGYEHIIKGGYSSFDVGRSFYQILNVEDGQIEGKVKNKKSQQSSKIKKRIGELKWELGKVNTLEEKLDILKDSFKDETCYLLSCGPSLSDYEKQELNEKLKDKLVLAVKQAYHYVPECVDFHFWNCSNLPMWKSGNPYSDQLHYRYDAREPIVVASSNYDKGQRWSPQQHHDIFFKIPIRTEIDNDFLCLTKNFEDYSLDITTERPCGPGIILETVLHTAVHLGVSKIVAIGYDLSKENPKKQSDHKHFYGETQGLWNRGDILPWEVKAHVDCTEEMYEWLLQQGVQLELASDKSALWSGIPRVKL